MKASTSTPMNGETECLSRMSRNQSVFSIYSTKSKIPKDPVVRHFEIHDLTQINFSMVYRLEEASTEVTEFEGIVLLLISFPLLILPIK
jgi:hypothetical protein